MRLHIYLKNDKEQFESIKSIAQNHDFSIFLESDEIVIENDTIIKEYIDLNKEKFSDAQDMARNFLNSINGLIKLYGLEIPALEVKLILFKHNNGTWLPVPVGAAMQACIVFGGEESPSIEKHVKLSSINKQVAKATRLYFQEINMVNLYKICELMKETGYKFPKKQLNTFKMSANKVAISGDNARHGEFAFKGELPTKTMTTDEAHSFIAKHMRIWLNQSSFN